MSLEAHWTVLLGLVQRRASLTDLDVSTVAIVSRLDEVVIIDHCFAVVALETVVTFELLFTGLVQIEYAVLVDHIATLDAANHLFSVFEPQTVPTFFAVRTRPSLSLVETCPVGRRGPRGVVLETVLVVHLVAVAAYEAFENGQRVVADLAPGINSGLLLVFVFRLGDFVVQLVLQGGLARVVDALVVREVVIVQEVVDDVRQSFVRRQCSVSNYTTGIRS